MAVTTLEATDTLDAGRVKINANFVQTLNKGVSPANGLYVGGSLPYLPGHFNQDVPPIEFFHYGKFGSPVGTELDRTQLPKGFVAFGASLSIVNNWQWDNGQTRAEPYDTDFPMITIENGGEGVLCHYTAPGGLPSTHFHEITRFGGGVDGLSGVDPYTTYVPFNQFKACIYACYSSSTTPPAGTDEAWWGGTGNTLGGILNPLLWLRSEETKGTDFEFAAFEQNSSNNSPSALYFKKSRGTNQTKTAISSGDVVGRVGWKGYDGDEYHITAFIDAVAAATATNNTVPLDIRFYTASASSTTEKFRITNDGVIKTFVCFRNDLTTVTGIPNYSAFASFIPTTSGSTSLDMRPLSLTNGGMLITGLTNVTASGIALLFQGLQGHTAPTAASIVFKACKHNGTTSVADLAAAEIVAQFRNNATTLIEILGSGCAGFGATTPTALVHCGASSTARAGLRVVPGPAPSSPNNGDIWVDSTAHTAHIRINGVTKTITLT